MNNSPVSSPPAKIKVLLILAKTFEKQKFDFSRSALFHMGTRVSLKYTYLLNCPRNNSMSACHIQVVDARCSILGKIIGISSKHISSSLLAYIG